MIYLLMFFSESSKIGWYKILKMSKILLKKNKHLDDIENTTFVYTLSYTYKLITQQLLSTELNLNEQPRSVQMP